MHVNVTQQKNKKQTNKKKTCPGHISHQNQKKKDHSSVLVFSGSLVRAASEYMVSSRRDYCMRPVGPVRIIP